MWPAIQFGIQTKQPTSWLSEVPWPTVTLSTRRPHHCVPCCLPAPADRVKQTRYVLWTSGFSFSLEKTNIKMPHLKLRYKPQRRAKIRCLSCWRSTSILISRPMESLAPFFVFSAPPMENSRKMWKHWVRMNCWVSLCLWFGTEKRYKMNSLHPTPCYIFTASSFILYPHFSLSHSTVYSSL